MTTATVTLPRATLAHAVHSEWTKLWSLRSTMWSLLAAAVITIGSGLLTARAVELRGPVSAEMLVSFALMGIIMSQLAVLVLGALTMTGEYGTGAIRTSLTAVPRRGRLLAAKAAVLGAVSLVAGMAISFASFFATRWALSLRVSEELPGLAADGVLRAVLGGGLYLAVLSLFALAVGTILRHGAAAMTATIAITLILPPILVNLGKTGRTIAKWWPTEAGRQITFVESIPGQLTSWQGFGVFCAATAGLLAIAHVLLRGRDA